FYEAPIYARTSGYLKNWYTDIGTAVKKGRVLAEIDTPEVDQQLRQAEADLATADANYELARTTNERWKGLLATESVSQQDADRPTARYEATVASTAHALDATSRTLQVELQIDNAQGELLPGSYAQVHFTLAAGSASTLRIPVNTVLFRANGLEVATLDGEYRVHLKSIT